MFLLDPRPLRFRLTLLPSTPFVFRRLLNKLDAAISTSPFLENITLVDTPGVLSGEMQMHQRAYVFADVSLDSLKGWSIGQMTL